MPKLKKKTRQMQPSRMLVLGFSIIILAGATLLFLPISSKSGQFSSFIDCLFTATSATCVTGITVLDTFNYFNGFGQGVILALIQVGGLGFLTLVTFINLILGKKLGMTQIFTPEGKVIPVTVVEAGPCKIAQVKTMENDGYTAIQLGFGAVKPVNVTKPSKGHTDKAGIDPVKYLREIRVKDVSAYNPGDTVTVDIFAPGEIVDVSGVSKGKGFAGTI